MQHLTEEDIAVCAEALENGTYDSLPGEMRAHLSECDSCAEEVLAVCEVTADFRFEKPESLPLWSKSQKIIAWSVSAAAAAVFLLIISESGPVMPGEGLQEDLVQTEDSKPASVLGNKPGIAATKNRKESPDQEKLSLQNEVANQLSKNEPGVDADETKDANVENPRGESELLAHYQPNEEMEKLIARTQGGLRNAEKIDVQTPVSLHVDRTPFLLEWSNKENARFIIEVLDNTGDRMLKTETTGNRYQVERLSNGLYYWKLISRDFDLLFCGRILVGEE